MAEENSGSDQVGGRHKIVEQTCKPCEKKKKISTVADVYCKNCEEFQCKECSKVHDMFGFMNGHELVVAEEAQPHHDIPALPVVDMKGLDICSEHTKQLDCYCVDENKLCCSHCVIECHRKGCKDLNRLSEEAQKNKPDVANAESDLSDLQASANKLIRFLQETNESVGSELPTVLDQIEEIKQAVEKKLCDLKISVTEKIQTQKEKVLEETDPIIHETKNVIERVKELRSTVMTVFSNGTEEQKFIAGFVLQQQNAKHLAGITKQTSGINRPVVSLKSNALIEILQSIERLTTPLLDTVHVDTAAPVCLDLMASVDLKKCNEEEDAPLYTGMDFFPDGKLAVVDDRKYKLIVMDFGLKELCQYKFQSYVCCVAVISQDEVAVTSGSDRVIEFLHVSKSNVITLIRSVKTTANYDSICLMNETTFLVSTYDDKRPLRMVTVTGEEKNFENLPEKQYDLGDSWSTYIRNRDILVLTDSNDNTVYMYDNKNGGALICTVKDESIKEPTGVCVGPDDSLVVCSNGTHSIVHVSPSGRVLGSHKLEMTFPFTVGISKDGKTLAVSNNLKGKRVLQLFNVKSNCN